jgi:hypothetical protein
MNFPVKIGSIFYVKEPHYTLSEQFSRIVTITDINSLIFEES